MTVHKAAHHGALLAGAFSIHVHWYHHRHALPEQAPGHASPGYLKLNDTFICGDHTTTASIEGAIISGQKKQPSMTPTKICQRCGRLIEWRKKWENRWDEIRYCSARCRSQKLTKIDQQLEQAILSLLATGPRGKTICPSEAIHTVFPEEQWSDHMEQTRQAPAASSLKAKSKSSKMAKPSTPPPPRPPSVSVKHSPFNSHFPRSSPLIPRSFPDPQHFENPHLRAPAGSREMDWEEVRPGVEVKRIEETGEQYVLARSSKRAGKERSMRRRRLKKLWARLAELQAMQQTRDELLMRLGATKKEAGRAWNLLRVDVPESDGRQTWSASPTACNAKNCAPPRAAKAATY